uniref:stearoyl-CoA 9-desaturase n=1 Tax=Moniliophthora roreri TaxID=221103 RepID=A0A0W0F6L9_MONRR
MSDKPQLEEPADLHIPDNYVSHILKTTKPLPPVTWSTLWGEIQWISFTLLIGVPIVGAIGACYTALRWETFIWSVIYYFCTGLGITAGYHRLWSHRAYNASIPLQYALALFGAGAGQGSIKWWSRGHRAHHRYTDTDLDPYNAHQGFWYSHVGWILVKSRRKPGVSDISDLNRNPIVKWQHKNYSPILLFMAFALPTLVAHLGWNDARGGFVYAGLLRLAFVHQSTFCVNSLAHWLGEAPFDDKHTPRDHMITALVTIGEGYHNFHHQFPMDFRNAIKWYQYDPTKWAIWTMSKLGLASHLKVFPDNEVRKGELTMQLKKLRETQDNLTWPTDSNDLPVISWETFQNQSNKRPLILISGFIHDVSDFLEEHPGGRHLLVKYIGKDATTAFFGGVYGHSNAAHNLLAMKRVGILYGGHPHALDDKTVPPGSRLKFQRLASFPEYKEETNGSTLDMESPYQISISDSLITALRQKLDLVRFPDEIDNAGWEYGAPLQDIKRLVSRWKDGYDWKKHEKYLNDELPQFTRDINVDGFGTLNVHYVHKKCQVVENAIPLLFVHGWPGSFVEVRKILPLLTQGTPSFHVVAVGLPGFGFSEGAKKKGFSIGQYAEVSHKLMLALGYNEYVTQGGDWGYIITRTIAATYGPSHVKAWHTNFFRSGTRPEIEQPEEYTEADKAGLERSKWFQEKGSGYFAERSTQPQTLGYSLADSPVGLLGWIYEKLVNWTDAYSWEDDEKIPAVLVLTWISIYWFSRPGPAASVRIYYEYKQAGGRERFLRAEPLIPLGNSYFPRELWVPPHSWIKEKNLVFESRHDSGGHFAAYEKPDQLADDLRRMFVKDGPAFGVVPGRDGYA